MQNSEKKIWVIVDGNDTVIDYRCEDENTGAFPAGDIPAGCSQIEIAPSEDSATINMHRRDFLLGVVSRDGAYTYTALNGVVKI